VVNVPTLTGMVPPEELGVVALSEHLLYGLPGWWFDPYVHFDRPSAFEKIRTALEDFRKAGGKTIVETSGLTLGRDVAFYKRLSEVTGVQIVAATGFDTQEKSIPGHFYSHANLYSNVQGPYYWYRDVPGNFYPQDGATKEYLMFLFYNELYRGMIVSGMVRTRIKAGIVKTAASWDRIVLPIEELSIRAAAMSAKRAGLYAYFSDHVNQAKEALDLMAEEGIAPDRVIVGHCDDGRAIDIERDKNLAQKGYNVAYDHIGWQDKSLPSSVSDDQRVSLVKAMIDAGFANRVLLSCGSIAYGIGQAESKHSFSYLLTDFVPRLRRAGVEESAINTILIDNTKRALTSTVELKVVPPPYFGSPPPAEEAKEKGKKKIKGKAQG